MTAQLARGVRKTLALILAVVGLAALGAVALARPEALVAPGEPVIDLPRAASPFERTAEIVTWVMAFVLFMASILAIVRREHWLRPVVCALGAAVVFIGLTLLHPPAWLGLFAVLVIAVALLLPTRHGRHRKEHPHPAP